MTGTQISSDGLPPARKRALFRAWHRGTREMDLIVGGFADARLPGLDDADFADFEQLMEVPDRDLFAWIVGREPAPANYDTPVFRALSAFHGGAG